MMTMMKKVFMEYLPQNQTKLIVGLGNPGVEYKHNRHNVGFMLVDNIVSGLDSDFSYNKKFDSEIAKSSGYLFAKPQGYMNKSGSSVSKIMHFFNIVPKNLVVIHDDVDLEPMRIKISTDSSSAGHNGVEDIIQKLGTKEFTRVRIGVGRPENKNFDVKDYVLADFTKEELSHISNIVVDIYNL